MYVKCFVLHTKGEKFETAFSWFNVHQEEMITAYGELFLQDKE